ncbi:hypothetical protein [Leptospirillum ferrooxidans]|jgi:hypothetical protein|uniref:hypothetical protein n=1 Tax=Leptospirillum ferrooxidans TaxID=180 RepID=UPI0011D1E7A5|nr:hypothetical protein [Leptospirillum ferrooxidans]
MSDKIIELVPDKRGALWSGLFHGTAIFMSSVLSFDYYQKSHTSPLFYLFFFSLWLALFSGFTSVGSHCLLLFPKSLKSIKIGHRSVILTWKNGDADEIVRKLQFQGGRTLLGLWGQTIDKRRIQATIRRNSVSKDDFAYLLSELARIRDMDKPKP